MIVGPPSVALGGEIAGHVHHHEQRPLRGHQRGRRDRQHPGPDPRGFNRPCTTSPCNIGTLAPGQTKTTPRRSACRSTSWATPSRRRARPSSGVADPDTLTTSPSPSSQSTAMPTSPSSRASRQRPCSSAAATFIVTLDRPRPAPATGMVVQDLLPAGLTMDPFSASQGSYVPATGEVDRRRRGREPLRDAVDRRDAERDRGRSRTSRRSWGEDSQTPFRSTTRRQPR